MEQKIWICLTNIPSRASDTLIRELLSTCGPLEECKRVQTDDKKNGIALCRFLTADAGMRAARLLDDLNLSGTKLGVTVNTASKDIFEEYNLSNKTGLESNGKEAVDGDMGEIARRLDSETRLRLSRVVKLYEHEFEDQSLDPSPKAPEQSSKSTKKEEKKEENLSDMELEDDKKNLIHREIGKFRDTYKSNPTNVSSASSTSRNESKDRYSKRSPYERPTRRSPVENRNRERAPSYDYKKSALPSRRQSEKKQAKEQSYQQILRDWKKRENSRAREYDLIKLREKDKRLKEELESKKLKEFLEDYNDDRDDIRFYKGSSLSKRLADRSKEIEADEYSLRKEKQELELLSVKCASENNSNSIDHLNEDTNSNAFSINATFTDAAASTNTPLQLNIIASSSSTNSSTSGTSGNIVVSTEEKRKQIKDLIEGIPTSREELFAYNIDWSLLEDTMIANRIRPWISKKISEYIGEEEVSLIDFICTRLKAHSDGMSILRDVAVVLDDDAEGFVVKMWRLLIYEIEAKRRGLGRSS